MRRAGEFPQLIWKDTPPQHFNTTFGEYPEEAPKPPMEVLRPSHAYHERMLNLRVARFGIDWGNQILVVASQTARA